MAVETQRLLSENKMLEGKDHDVAQVWCGGESPVIVTSQDTRPVLDNAFLLSTHMSSQAATSSTSSPATMSVSLRTDSPLSADELPIHLDNITQENSDAATSTEYPSSPRRPLRMYTRPQLLSLSQSPMVKPPPDMPDLRTWFG